MSGTVALGDGHKLTLNQTSLGAVDAHRHGNIVSASHLEGQFFLGGNSEEAIGRSEIENGHSVRTAVGVHGEVERLHPSTHRAHAHVELVDNFHTTGNILHMEMVG